MRTFLVIGFGLTAVLAAAPAGAQEAPPSAAATGPTAPPPDLTFNASATLVSDYRFRGISQTDKNPAVQATVTVTHISGFYVSVFGSSVDDYVTASGRAHQEIDLIGGYKKTYGGTTFDGGVLYYYYPHTHRPGDRSKSDFFEPYLSLAHTLGPVTAKATVNYGPPQRALELDQGASRALKKRDHLYTAGDFTAAIPTTSFGLVAHVGHAFGPSWLATDAFGRTSYTDWGLGATATYRRVTAGVSYVDTDATFLSGNGKNVSNAGVVGSVAIAF